LINLRSFGWGIQDDGMTRAATEMSTDNDIGDLDKIALVTSLYFRRRRENNRR
jgi:hypothetical protein